jgi:hypothetical protein
MGLYRKIWKCQNGIYGKYLGNVWDISCKNMGLYDIYGTYLGKNRDIIYIYIYMYGKYLRNIWDICDISSYKGNT